MCVCVSRDAEVACWLADRKQSKQSETARRDGRRNHLTAIITALSHAAFFTTSWQWQTIVSISIFACMLCLFRVDLCVFCAPKTDIWLSLCVAHPWSVYNSQVTTTNVCVLRSLLSVSTLHHHMYRLYYLFIINMSHPMRGVVIELVSNMH